MKKVIVFGPTGTIGKHVLQQALKGDIEVTAFCRDRSRLDYQAHPQLQIIEGDVYDQEAVSEAIAGHDIVIIALGSGNSRKSTVRSEGTKHIIQGLKEHGVRRLICQSTLGAGDSNSNLNFFWKRIMFGWFLKQVFLDHELQEDYVMNSGLDWTIVRPGAFTDGSLTGRYQHGFGPQERQLQLKISRADVADFILKQLSSNQYLLKTPGLSY
ncbi:NAD(P)-dependent oxidoreductase [Reichenbachiella ulvae]|uniref:SDR family oxidoreductase n=1 Tax=Reichenbachiella ulvae TaxID=2980104 RepID=A0ABT3CVL1_9BACT|nr:SDR family oxidoreductase [Reichenbachiella ulvae]MCV9387637.1 SDR family oxidoreductase [Reichenbachiella ulvae]